MARTTPQLFKVIPAIARMRTKSTERLLFSTLTATFNFIFHNPPCATWLKFGIPSENNQRDEIMRLVLIEFSNAVSIKECSKLKRKAT